MGFRHEQKHSIIKALAETPSTSVGENGPAKLVTDKMRRQHYLSDTL